MSTATTAQDVKREVQDKYGRVAKAVTDGTTSDDAGCCSSACCGSATDAYDPITSNLYDEGEKAGVPAEALLASLGCGNPTALAQLNAGETVLDLGSGGGIDVLLSAKRVGPSGKVYGLDMTDEMLALANENKRKAGAENVEFLKGEIEAVPLPNDHVDVVISNCVINLSTEKEKVVGEAFRVLKPGGRFAVSDVVFLGEKEKLSAEVRDSVERWSGCISGALESVEYEALLRAAGFEEVSVEVTHSYQPEQVTGSLGPEVVEALREVPVASAFVKGRKPAEQSYN